MQGGSVKQCDVCYSKLILMYIQLQASVTVGVTSTLCDYDEFVCSRVHHVIVRPYVLYFFYF